MAGIALPLDLQSQLDGLQSQRALIQALRLHQGDGERYPGFGQAVASVGRAVFGDPLDALATKEQDIAQSFEKRRSGAMSDVLKLSGNPLADSGMSQDDEAAIASRAMSAGVPPDLIKSALSNRQSFRMLQSLSGDPLPSQTVGAGAPAAPPGAGAPAAGGAPPMAPPGAGMPPGAPQGPQQGGMMPFVNGGDPTANAISGAMKPRPTGTPLQNIATGKLITMGAVLPKDSPVAGLIAAELGARKVEVKDNIVTQGGTIPVGRFNRDSTFTDLQTGETYDPAGKLLAARAGGVAGAQAAAKAPLTPIKTTDSQGREVTTFAPQIPGYGGGAAPQGAPAGLPPAGNQRADFNLKGATQAEAQAAMQAAFGGGQQAPAPAAPAAALGTGPNPVTLAGGKSEAEAVGGVMGKQIEKIDSDAESAQVMHSRTAELRPMLDMIDPNMGSPARLKVAEGLFALGAPRDITDQVAGGSVPAMQAYSKQTVQMAFDATKQLTSRPAAAEVVMQIKANPNLAMTKPAQLAILDYVDGISQWKLAKQQFRDQYVNEQGTWKGGENAFNKAHPVESFLPSPIALKAALGGVQQPAANPALDALMKKYGQ